jgi:hypothetical protein
MLFYTAYNSRFSTATWLLVLSLVYGLLTPTAVSASDPTDRRIQISLPIFPRIVAVDNDFHKKLLPHDKVLLVFLYESDKEKAVSLADALKGKLSNVAGLEFMAAAVSVRDQLVATATVPTALFVAEPLSEQLFASVLEYAVKQQRILFSPYVGDVERGATAGISITSRVNPYLNVKTLKRADININAVLMNLSKRYE